MRADADLGSAGVAAGTAAGASAIAAAGLAGAVFLAGAFAAGREALAPALDADVFTGAEGAAFAAGLAEAGLATLRAVAVFDLGWVWDWVLGSGEAAGAAGFFAVAGFACSLTSAFAWTGAGAGLALAGSVG